MSPKFVFEYIKKEIFEILSNVAVCHILISLNINFISKQAIKILKSAESVNSDGSGLSLEVYFVFPDNPSRNILRLI